LLKEALSYLEKEYSTTDDPQRLAKIHLTTGAVFERMGDYQAAAENYKAAFGLPNERTETWYFIHKQPRYCLNRLGRHAEADKDVQSRHRDRPPQINAYKNLGLALQMQGIYPEPPPSSSGPRSSFHLIQGHSGILGRFWRTIGRRLRERFRTLPNKLRR